MTREPPPEGAGPRGHERLTTGHPVEWPDEESPAGGRAAAWRPGVGTPDDLESGESMWARLEREDREEVARTRGPLLLAMSGFALVPPGDLAGLTGAARWIVVCVAVVLTFTGLVPARTRRRRS